MFGNYKLLTMCNVRLLVPIKYVVHIFYSLRQQ